MMKDNLNRSGITIKCITACMLIVLSLFTSAQTVTIERFKNNPIITPAMLPAMEGDDINGPSLLKVPDWLPDKLGNYYLYFAHHANLPVTASNAGLYYGKVRQLREPYVYAEGGKRYLLYAAAGENAIAIGQLQMQ